MGSTARVEIQTIRKLLPLGPRQTRANPAVQRSSHPTHGLHLFSKFNLIGEDTGPLISEMPKKKKLHFQILFYLFYQLIL